MQKDIVVLQFSSRPNGNCSHIASYLENYYKTETVQIFTIDNNVVSNCGNCNYECLKPDVSCPNISSNQKAIMNAIIQADKAFFIIPNYCGYPCANYFAFNEHSVGYFNLDRNKQAAYTTVAKHFIFISNTEGNNFEAAVQQHVNGRPDVLYLKTRKYQIDSISGNLMKSEQAQSDLNDYLKSLNI